MKHRVYMRDWYFNAGVIGFLSTVAAGRDLKDIQGLLLGDNYIEFDDIVFDDFKESFTKQAFLKFFKKRSYTKKLQGLLEDFEEKKEKIKPNIITKKISNSEGSLYKNFLRLLYNQFYKAQHTEELIERLKSAIETIEGYTGHQILSLMSTSKEGTESVVNFVRIKLIGICSEKSIIKFIEDACTIDYSKKIEQKDICLSCQERKASYEFNNAISNIIGFNKDNSNWSWGYKSVKNKICPICSLIYTCALISFAYILRRRDNNWLNCFYFLNYNASIDELYKSTERFKLQLQDNNDEPLYVMIKETVRVIRSAQTDNINRNVNFIEIITNPILKGRSTEGYNIYNYNIDKEVASFLYPFMSEDRLPKGYYRVKNVFFNIDEELLKLTIQRQIDFSSLHRYFDMYVSDSVVTQYNLNTITSYIFRYIQHLRRETMEKSKRIVKKGFRNGIELRDRLISAKKENQIDGLVYGFLNDLKISDREKFLDKYIRIMMTHKLPMFFSEDEMLDTDYFLQFGYSFVNGLLKKEQKTESKTIKEK